MKYIVLIAMLVIVLLDIMILQLTGAIGQSSVGGALSLALAFLVAALALGIHEAFSKKRGVLGWTVNIAASLLGGIVATSLSGIVMTPILMLINLDESLAAAQHPLHFLPSAVMMLHALLGSWIALSIINKWR